MTARLRPVTAVKPRVPLRKDLALIAEMIDPGTKVLDVGCDDGALLDHLWRTKDVDGRGIEIKPEKVSAAVSRGLSVIQGDANTDLGEYPAGIFDYAILSQSLQVMDQPRAVLADLVRIGGRVIVSFPNFGYWRVRLSLLSTGRMPMTPSLTQSWYETANIHFCTILDFLDLVRDMTLEIRKSAMLVPGSPTVIKNRRTPGGWRHANWAAEQAVFLLSAR